MYENYLVTLFQYFVSLDVQDVTVTNEFHFKLIQFICLMLCILNIIFSRQHFEIFFLIFFQKIGFDILKETICMKYQNLFSGKNKKIIVFLSSAELTWRVIKFQMTQELRIISSQL